MSYKWSCGVCIDSSTTQATKMSHVVLYLYDIPSQLEHVKRKSPSSVPLLNRSKFYPSTTKNRRVFFLPAAGARHEWISQQLVQRRSQTRVFLETKKKKGRIFFNNPCGSNNYYFDYRNTDKDDTCVIEKCTQNKNHTNTRMKQELLWWSATAAAGAASCRVIRVLVENCVYLANNTCAAIRRQ